MVRATSLVRLLGAVVLAGCGHSVDHPPAAHDGEPLIEAPACGTAPAADATRPIDGERTVGAAVVTVQIAPTALVRVDDQGRVIAAWTNTGCAPRHADDLYVEHPDGSIRRAGPTAVDGHRWIGDFTQPGVVAPQTSRQ